MTDRHHDAEQQEQYIQILKEENKLMQAKISALIRKIEKAKKSVEEYKNDSIEKKQALDSLSAELGRIKRKMKRLENKK